MYQPIIVGSLIVLSIQYIEAKSNVTGLYRGGKPSCAGHGATFCEKVTGYPEALLHKAMKHLETSASHHQGCFGVIERHTSVENRMLGSDGAIPMCHSIERIIMPRIAKNKDNQWQYIVNGDPKGEFVQAIKVEVCNKEGDQCAFHEHMPVEITTTCKQKYIMRRLIAMGENGTTFSDVFEMPSVCSCAYIKNEKLKRAKK